jgi:hypothetical protein
MPMQARLTRSLAGIFRGVTGLPFAIRKEGAAAAAADTSMACFKNDLLE